MAIMSIIRNTVLLYLHIYKDYILIQNTLHVLYTYSDCVFTQHIYIYYNAVCYTHIYLHIIRLD